MEGKEINLPPAAAQEPPHEMNLEMSDAAAESARRAVEDVYGINDEELSDLLNSLGNMKVGAGKTGIEYSQTRQTFRMEYDQAKTKLVDRIVSGEANELEIKLAREHFKKAAKFYTIANSQLFPPQIFSNKIFVDAVSQTENPNVNAFNREFAESKIEELKKKK